MTDYTLHMGDCLEYMATLPDSSVDLIATDPPYFKVKNEWWDRQWETGDGFLAWMAEVMAEFYRILRPNGSLYVFASPRMAWGVEGVVRERFAVLNHLVWNKAGGSRANKASKEMLRAFFGESERIIFAEHYNADNIAKGEAGYAAKCDELRGFVFEPLRAYLDGERQRAGATTTEVHEAWCDYRGTKGRMVGHWFGRSQWALPTADNYEWLRQTFSRLNHGGDYLRREYEDLRRPFNATPDAPYTDVWTFPTVNGYAGKHPTEKPLNLMEHIVKLSSRPGSVVFDPFMGSGTTGVAALRHGRKFIGCDATPKWYERAQERIDGELTSVQQATLLEVGA